MHVFWGIVVTLLSLLAWGGQAISWLAPGAAVKLGLVEPEAKVEPVYWADIRGEAAWDALTLWTLVVAGVLLAVDRPQWAYFGLVGGGAYVYFAGRGILTRTLMLRRGFRVGTPANVRAAFVLLGTWGVVGLVTIVAAVVALPVP